MPTLDGRDINAYEAYRDRLICRIVLVLSRYDTDILERFLFDISSTGTERRAAKKADNHNGTIRIH